MGQFLCRLTPISSDYLDLYSLSWADDIASVASLTGFSFTSMNRMLNLSYDAFFSDHGVIETTSMISGVPSSGIPSAVPEPSTFILLLTAGVTLAAMHLKRGGNSPFNN